MKNRNSVLFLILFGLYANNLIAQDKAEIPLNQKTIGLELAKPLFWFMKDLGIIIEPEFAYQYKSMIYMVSVGYNSINDKIYNALDYKNNGSHLKLGVGVQFNYNKEKVKKNRVIFGANLIFSNFTEKARAYSNNTLYNGFGTFNLTMGQDYKQSNNARGFETFFIYRRDFDNNFYASISPQLNVILSEMSSENFPIYYASGFGIISDNDGDGVSISPFSELGEGGSLALSIKVGYRF